MVKLNRIVNSLGSVLTSPAVAGRRDFVAETNNYLRDGGNSREEMMKNIINKINAFLKGLAEGKRKKREEKTEKQSLADFSDEEIMDEEIRRKMVEAEKSGKKITEGHALMKVMMEKMKWTQGRI